MAELEIIGFDLSNWVRAARIACEEKGVAYTLTPPGTTGVADLKTEKHLALHPFGRIPAMRHGDVVLFETLAIGHYIDRMFEGRPLVPDDPLEAVRVEQWLSAMIDYVSRSIIRGHVMHYVFPKGPDGEPDRAAVEAGIPEVRAHLAILDKALADGPYLHGETPYLDDFVLLPMLDVLCITKEGPDLLAEAPNVARHRTHFQKRPSYEVTIPEKFRQAA